MSEAQMHPLFDKHINTLRKAIAAAETRTGWSPHPEVPASRGETAAQQGREAFDAYRDASFYLDQPGVIGRVGTERSPYGLPLNITYPQCSADTLILAAKNAMTAWVEAGPDVRTGVCLEILDRIHDHGIEIAHAVMHTTGQSFALAYQHSLAAALDRSLEAVASAYREMKQVPGRRSVEKSQGKGAVLKVEMAYTIAPRGVALTVGSPTEPTSLSWPGLFASLVTGNPVIVHPHPGSVLPQAIAVAVARQVVKEAGFDASLVSLLVDDVGSPSVSVVGLRPEIRIIDCSGEAQSANWLEENAHQAAMFSILAGANSIVVDSVRDYKGMLRNLTFSLCQYSGQLAGAPRLIFVSREGIQTPDGVVSAEKFERDLAFAIGKLLENDARAAEILGAIHSPDLLDTIEHLRDEAGNDEDDAILRDISRLQHPHWPTALLASPLLLKCALNDEGRFLDNMRGLVAFVVEATTTTEALSAVERVMREKGAFNLSLYSESVPIQNLAQGIASRVGVTLNINFCGSMLLGKTDAFSDFFASGENPAASCSLIDAAFVARRFFVVQSRRQVT